MNTLKTKLSISLGIAAVICLAAAVSLLLHWRITGMNSENLLSDMRQQAEEHSENDMDNSNGDIPNTESLDETISEDSSQEPQPEPVVNPYQDSFLSNEDMAAWIKIEGTKIDYPVMWTPREETYYLYRNFEGKEDNNGCLLLDTDSCLDPLTTNLIIHGHNMRSGAMFGTLTNYQDENYCKEHNTIVLYTEDRERRYEIVSVFRSQVFKKTDQVFKFYKFFQADTQEDFDDFYQNIKALSLYDTGVTAEFGDHFITLSTCVYHVEHGRFVVVAKEIESGDTYIPFRN